MKKKNKVRRCARTLFLFSSLVTLGGCIESFLYLVLGGWLVYVFVPFIYMPFTYGGTTGSHVPGASTPHSVILGPPGKTLETYNIKLSFSSDYTFNGFDTLGGMSGYYGIIGRDGTVRRNADIWAIDSDTAFIDLNDSGQYEAAFEPIIIHSMIQFSSHTTSGTHEFDIMLPGGGDGDTSVNARDITDKGVLDFSSGILDNPSTPGTYTVSATFTSVDPDTGEADDSQGTDPHSYTDTTTVNITSDPTVDVFTDATTYSTGHTQTLYVNLFNPGSETTVDVYLAVMLPDGSLLFVEYDVNTGISTFVPGDVDPATWTPAVTGLPLSAALTLTNFTVLTYEFTGGEPEGTYNWFAAFTNTGTTDVVGGVASSEFLFSP